MEIKINIGKKHLYIFAALCVVLIGAFSFANPPLYHTLAEIFTTAGGVSIDADGNGVIDELVVGNSANLPACDTGMMLAFNKSGSGAWECFADSATVLDDDVNITGDITINGRLQVGTYKNFEGGDYHDEWVNVTGAAPASADTCDGNTLNPVNPRNFCRPDEERTCVDYKVVMFGDGGNAVNQQKRSTLHCVRETATMDINGDGFIIKEVDLQVDKNVNVGGNISAAGFCFGGECSESLLPRCEILHPYDSSEYAKTGYFNISVPSYCRDGRFCNIILKTYGADGLLAKSSLSLYSEYNNSWMSANWGTAGVNGDSKSDDIIGAANRIYLYDDADKEYSPGKWSMRDNWAAQAGEIIACPSALPPK